VRRAALALLLLAGCARRGPSSPEAPLARRLLAVANDLAPASAGEATAELERLAARARAELDRRGAASPADVLNRVVFDDEGFRREVEDTDIAFALLPSVLSTRRGSCVGLGSLYLALGDLLGVPMRGVVLPGHFFVRVREGDRWRNVELLRRGEEEPPDWYRARWPTPATTTAVYDRPLGDDEVIGVIEYDAGNDLRRQGRLPEARRAFERAVALFPSLPEAQASLGAVLQLAGALDPALTAYRAAARLEPGLPGLERNVRLLEEERGAR
jgi:regulator of sirC expression with transglutaminase-like and TPR domain